MSSKNLYKRVYDRWGLIQVGGLSGAPTGAIESELKLLMGLKVYEVLSYFSALKYNIQVKKLNF